jgi:hypothetical protein
MIKHNKTYGFTIAVKELRETVPNIFRYASAYKRLNNLTSQGLWEMFVEPQPDKDEKKDKAPAPEDEPGRLSEIDMEAMEGEKYNMCHFWSNFEIARLDFFRSKEYNDFFQMMDRSGGFWMERVRFLIPSMPFLTYSPLLTIHTVGRRANPLARSRRAPRAARHPLLPRLRLPPHHDPALPGQRALPAAAARAVPREDDARREEAHRGGPVLGRDRPAPGERRGLSLPLRHGYRGRRGQGGELSGGVGRCRRWLGESVIFEK